MTPTAHFAITMLWITQMFCQNLSLLFLFSQKWLLKRLNTTCFRLTGSDWLWGTWGAAWWKTIKKQTTRWFWGQKSISLGRCGNFLPLCGTKSKHPLMTGNCSNVKNCHPGQTIDERVERVSRRMWGSGSKRGSQRAAPATKGVRSGDAKYVWKCLAVGFQKHSPTSRRL